MHRIHLVRTSHPALLPPSATFSSPSIHFTCRGQDSIDVDALIFPDGMRTLIRTSTRVCIYHTCAWTCTRGQIHDFDIQDSARLQIKTTLDCLMFAFLRESDEAVLRVQSISAASVQKENHAHLSEGSNSTVGSLQTSFTLFEVL